MSQQLTGNGLVCLIERLDEAVQLGDVDAITGRIKADLEAASRAPLTLPDRYLVPRRDCYARRLLHRNRDLGYTVVVMTWGPGQTTPLHDHAGIWCVECVVTGELDVSQYDLLRTEGARYYFEEKKRVRAAVGDAGCLIPPFEYHVLGNPLADAVTVTLHVYGGEMDHCHMYKQQQTWWERQRRNLEYYAQ